MLVNADLETRAGRIVKREEGDVKKRKQEILIREKSEAIRYKNYYNINLNDMSIYNIVIDSSSKSPEKIVDIIIQRINE